MALLGAGYDDAGIAGLCMSNGHGISELPREKGPAWLEQEFRRARRKATNLTRRAKGEPEDGYDLLVDQRRPSKALVDGLLNEGMILFGGKPKRGKSWLHARPSPFPLEREARSGGIFLFESRSRSFT